MADERVGTRDFDTRKKLSWTQLLRTFLIALDPFKLLVAAAGVLVTAIGWWLLSAIFYGSWTEPKEPNDAEAARFKLINKLAGPGGTYRTMPWYEDRGRNPFFVTEGAIVGGHQGREAAWDWFKHSQVPNLIEPLNKFLSPIVGLFNPHANFWVKIYLFTLIAWMLAVWAFCGGVITRMAIVQIAGKEGGGLRESIKFVKARYLSYLLSPIVPIGLIFAVVLGCIVFGLIHLIPGFGDLFDGVLWFIPLGAGVVMALLLVGLVGYPLMYTTLSAEGSDTFDALSRSYNYVYESPWQYIWYGFISTLYGCAVVFFVVFMSSLIAYLGKWGVSQTPLTQSVNRSPEFLFIYTPTSYGWREVMLKGSPVEITPDKALAGPDKEHPQIAVDGYYYTDSEAANFYINDPEKGFYKSTYVGAGLVGFWVTLLFMMTLGFSYSFFWTQASMIYLLMRKRVDEVEIDEIYTEDEEFEEPLTAPKLSTPSAPAAPTTIPVDAPTLRVPPASPPSPPAPPTLTPTVDSPLSSAPPPPDSAPPPPSPELPKP